MYLVKLSTTMKTKMTVTCIVLPNEILIYFYFGELDVRFGENTRMLELDRFT